MNALPLTDGRSYKDWYGWGMPVRLAISCIAVGVGFPVAGQIAPVAVTGDSVPGGNGSFSTFTEPVINDLGQILFEADLTGTSGSSSDDSGFFLGTTAAMTEIVRENTTAPDGNGRLRFFSSGEVNGTGAAAFGSLLVATSGGGLDNFGIFLGDGGPVVQIARAFDPAPDADGTFGAFRDPRDLNNAGAAAFHGSLFDTSNTDGIFRGDGTTLTQIARKNDPAPDGNGTLNLLRDPAINDAGQVAFHATLLGSADTEGIFRGDGATLIQIARRNDPAPDGEGTFSFMSGPAINGPGMVVFHSLLAGDTNNPIGNPGTIICSDGVVSTQIVKTSQTVPDGNGIFASLTFGQGRPAVNDAEQMVFFSTVAGSTNGFSDAGIFFYDRDLGILQVARIGQPLLGSTISDLPFHTRGHQLLNQSGQVTVHANLADGRSGVFLWTPPGGGGTDTATSISGTNRYAWGSNTGWSDWQGNTTDGARIGTSYCEGFIWDANTGWIHLGDGSPSNGFSYSNADGLDAGVNHDGVGNLRGLAWGGNIGWVVFENNGAPSVDLLTGGLSGFAWGANVGWINLGDMTSFVRTGSMPAGPDNDKDGIPDAWEMQKVGDLSTLNAGTADQDGDGVPDMDEFVADTDPDDVNDFLHMISVAPTNAATDAHVTWKSKPTRVYRIDQADVLEPPDWADSGLGAFLGDPAAETSRTVPGTSPNSRAYRVEVSLPLSP